LKKNEENIQYLYDGIRQYLDILIHNDELNEAKNVIDKIITLIKEDDSDNKKEISKFSIFKLGIFILEDNNNSFKKLFGKYE
jgi:ribosomal protein L17